MLRIGSPIGSSGLGDIALLTAICKQTKCIVELPPKAERFARLFKYLADVEIKEKPVVTGECGWGLYIKRKLRFLSLDEEDCLPKIILDKEDLNFVSNYASSGQKLIAFVPNCSAHWAKVREMPKETWVKILEQKRKSGFKIIQFGLSSTKTDFGGLVDEVKFDLSVEELIRHYAAIKNYLGVDTGDVQIMIGVGGSVECFYPKVNHYNPAEWQYEGVNSIKYYPFPIL